MDFVWFSSFTTDRLLKWFLGCITYAPPQILLRNPLPTAPSESDKCLLKVVVAHNMADPIIAVLPFLDE
jgi:hypothetical protein